MTAFEIIHGNGLSRIGELKINGKVLSTPYLFPVINFFCGGNWKSKFGGGIYRNLKEEFLVNPKFSEVFRGVMTSISHISYYNISKEKLENLYLSKTIHEWFSYQGILFVDSGGYKLLKNGGIMGKNFCIEADSKQILSYQVRFGADIIVSLDYPITPDLLEKEKRRRIEFSVKNAVWTLQNKPRDILLYLAVHGYSKKELFVYLNTIFRKMEEEGVSIMFDGIAVGSLVPLKNDYGKLIEVVKSCKDVLKRLDLEHLPVHVFGISSSMLPVLMLLGIDTFDSASYLYAAINGLYYDERLKRRKISKMDFEKCSCEICRNENYRKRIRARKIASRDRLSPIAIHNLIKHHNELQKMKEAINEDEKTLYKYVMSRFNGNRLLSKLIRKHIFKGIC